MKKYIILAFLIISGVALLMFYQWQRIFLIKEYISLNKQLWQSEDTIVKNLAFLSTDTPSDILDLGETQKCFLKDQEGKDWIFKIYFSRLQLYFSCKMDRFMRFCGFETPTLSVISLPINGKLYSGTIQKKIDLKKGYLSTIDKKIEKLDKMQKQNLLMAEVVYYIFNDFDFDWIMGVDNKIYIVDFDDMSFSPAYTESNFNEVYSLNGIPGFLKLVDTKEGEKILKSKLKEEENSLDRNLASKWQDIYINQEKPFYYLHLYLVSNKILPDLEETSKLINLVMELPDKYFLELVDVPELKQYNLSNNFLKLLIFRKHNLKEHFRFFYNLFSADYGIEMKLDFDKKYTNSELKRMVQGLKKKVEKLSHENEFILKHSIKQNNINVAGCPEASWLFNQAKLNKIIKHESALTGLQELYSESNNSGEKEAISIIINKLKESRIQNN